MWIRHFIWSGSTREPKIVIIFHATFDRWNDLITILVDFCDARASLREGEFGGGPTDDMQSEIHVAVKHTLATRFADGYHLHQIGD